ncbi:hypothetical protein [Streptomyces sp. NPDC046832]|uniref:hypothetical protein n=1 Tax=Streptomyces sp. NPDC046832 TaxID=3155020 RepID=UPI0034073D7C
MTAATRGLAGLTARTAESAPGPRVETGPGIRALHLAELLDPAADQPGETT